MTAFFVAFPKIARLNRDIVITEKIDGTNAAVVITERQIAAPGGGTEWDGENFDVVAQSRTRILSTESKEKDNFGFARWVEENAEGLKLLGPGHHYGEWYGRGIQRGYGLADRRFALFNVNRWAFDAQQAAHFQTVAAAVPGLELVPVLYRGPRIIDNPEWPYDVDASDYYTRQLGANGSKAVPGYANPEGVVVFHTASRQLYKVTLEGDAQWKGPNAQSPS